jgi:glyoxylase-like metal-dependent hydrolase (beta-lactamase superfamily II)
VTNLAYTKGLHELGDGLFAYLQPDGGWGWSNAGLVTAGESSLLIDTLFDMRLTREMLASMRPVTDTRPIETAVNTHGNGDHCFGNPALPDATTIIATTRAVEGMKVETPALLHALLQNDLGPELNEFAQYAFGPFDFEGLEPRLPTQTFDGRIDLELGGRTVEVIEVGPAHTAGDAILHVPDAATVFTGDILFIDGTPIVWAGPIANWIAACDTLIALDARTLVPGHGPVTDNDGVRAVKDYFAFITAEAKDRFDAGMDARDAADDIELGRYADLGDPERIVQNVEQVYRELDPTRPETSRLEIFAAMSAWRKRHGHS